MIVDDWKIIHIALAVDDIEAAKALYSATLGIEWGPTAAFDEYLSANPGEYASRSAIPGFEVGVEGLMSSNPLNARLGPDGRALAPIELIHATPGSPAARFWGCADGKHYIHHIAYSVDDYAREADHLAGSGMRREWWFEKDGVPVFGYFSAENSLRIELIQG